MHSTERSPRNAGPVDVGTLWTMHRGDHVARCALLARSGGWIVRVLVDAEPLLEEQYIHADDAFTVAEQWRVRMTGQGWHQVVPGSHAGPATEMSAHSQ